MRVEGITFAGATWLSPNLTGHSDVQANFTTDATSPFGRDGWVVKQHNEYLKSHATIILRAAKNCRFERCTFTRLGGAGIDLEHGSHRNPVNQCHFFDISGSAIQIGGTQAADHHPNDPRRVVRDNFFDVTPDATGFPYEVIRRAAVRQAPGTQN